MDSSGTAGSYLYRVPLLWLSSTASTFFLRLSWPVGTSLPLIAVQPGFLPEYILSYTLGLVSSFTEIPHLLTPWSKNKTLKDNAKSSPESILKHKHLSIYLFNPTLFPLNSHFLPFPWYCLAVFSPALARICDSSRSIRVHWRRFHSSRLSLHCLFGMRCPSP